MTQENDSNFDHLEQIVKNQKNSVETLEKLKNEIPEFSIDFAAMQRRSEKNIEEILAIYEAEKSKAEEIL